MDWAGRDIALEDYVADLAALRAAADAFAHFPLTGVWENGEGAPMREADWENPASSVLAYRSADPARPRAFTINRASREVRLGD